MTTIGILGSGALGSNVARALASAGVSAMIANSRGPQSLQALTDETGPLIKAVTAEEAASADVVLIALRWSALPEVLSTLP
ncbi:NAD(P)-binding domain-containing protein, partial [Pseudomonas viridiflava]